MRIVIAPDKFKGTLTAPQCAAAMADGARRAFPEAAIDCRPMADGGEGTVDALLVAIGGRPEEVDVTGPIGSPVRARIGWLDDGRVALEVASAAGLGLLTQPDPLRASSRGCGELIAHILRLAPEASILVGMGGSASTDGGKGAARALGWRFLDSRGRELDDGGGSLHLLVRIDTGEVSPALENCSVDAWTDVDNPLTGPRGTARVFAPQKGASPEEVRILEQGIETLAKVIQSDLGIDVGQQMGAGAAGGIGAGLVAFFGARIAPGFRAIADATGLPGLIAEADVVLTGEGRLDEGSLGGKTAVGVARLAGASGIRCVAVVGQLALDLSELEDAGFDQVVSLAERVGPESAQREAAAALTDATADLLMDTPGGPAPAGYSEA
jgi:glycerate kinase